MVVALLLCTSAVTPIPAQKASGFFSTLRLRTVRRRAPKTRITPFEQYESPRPAGRRQKAGEAALTRVQGSPYRYMFLKQLNDQRTGNTLTGIFTVPFDIRFSG